MIVSDVRREIKVCSFGDGGGNKSLSNDERMSKYHYGTLTMEIR